ncbi:plasma membrane ascorbate-dependent reductase CYBRD1-like isoform X2 [Leguminivora glycinivorella]|uniref:plasma membrane ascorbate-dependent reductase CYBRD1-like isoform X2 n=1 Tax=Leguminivora glycinivorella TaxID=1035111 RepID=UPI0020106F10|nr:plasma membrane ascorbate-dependent reductase CYBRD1-like isoform X2 [Leguminivora glycinivorella]
MDSNSVSPMPELAPIAEFDKSPPSPPNEEVPMDDLPPPPATISGQTDGKKVKIQRSRSYDSDDNERGACEWCEYALVITLATILLIGVSALTIFWTLFYREGYAWVDDIPEKQFNLHPTLMVAGFVTFSGFSVLLYRICRCFRRIYVKLLHAIFHALAFPCIVIGFLAVLDYHNKKGINNFYSLHSWIGLTAMGLFGIQYAVGFFSFLLLLICNKGTAGFRASLVPVHAAFGILTFVLGVCACLTGLTEKALFTITAPVYATMSEESIVMNAIGVSIVAVAIVVLYTVRGTGGYRLRKVAAHHPS